MPDLFVAKKSTPHKEDKKDTWHASPKEKAFIKKLPSALSGKSPRHMRSTSAYSLFPNNIQFENQEEGEIIYLFLRRHIVTNVGWVVFTIIFAFLPVLMGTLILPVLESVGIIIPPNFIFILLIFYYLIVFGYAFVSYVSWFFNIGIITNLRVVDIDVDDITNKSVAATEIESLIDVEYKQHGFLQNLFDYGNMFIQIEGLKPNFEFLSIPHPAKSSDIVSDLMREVKHD